ncbi:flagellin FliC, partial [Salmonella enterica subsp. enterica]|nr:flagellin FliC [Salmonella enterica subsp. enterica serovar Limete]EHH0818738.1 flagellin FliC [Salmonella enterica subsp. enterica serovar Java]
SIQAEITQRLNEIDRVSGQTQFNGVKVLAQDNTLTIQVGANDGETIDIDLKQINSQTLGLDTLSVQDAYTPKGTAVTRDVTTYKNGGTTLTAPNAAAIDTALGTTGAAGTAAVKFKDGNYFVEVTGTTKDGLYEATVDAAGAVTMTANKATVTGASTVTENQIVDAVTPTPVDTVAAATALTNAGVTGATGNTSLVKMSFEDKNGKVTDAGYALKVGNDYYAADYDEKTGEIKAKTVNYTDATGATKTGAVKFGGANGKTEVVTTVDGNTYQASDVKGHNFQSGGALSEAVTTKTENPLAKIDAALAQVDALRSDLGAVQNRFNSAITNLGNTVNNLSEARSRIEDSDYATEVSNMSRAQILQQAGTSVLAQANQVPQNVLSLLR